MFSVLLFSVLLWIGVSGDALGQRKGGDITASRPSVVRFGMTSDLHFHGSGSPKNVGYLKDFTRAMAEWKPDFVVDLGDFAVQCGGKPTTAKLHDCQLEWLRKHWKVYSSVPCPAYVVMGNHDVGWLAGGDETIKPKDLFGTNHGGEDITKSEFLAVTRMPGRYYSFDVKGCHFIVLDANNWNPVWGKQTDRDSTEDDSMRQSAGRDGVVGSYWIDERQKAWLAKDLEANRGKIKIVFCHQELHHTPVAGSEEGGDVPFPKIGKEESYVDNGWELRKLFTEDGNVLAVFAGHKHVNRWTVRGGVNYITLAGTHVDGSFAKVTVADKLLIEGHRKQRSYCLDLPNPSKEKSDAE